jgi:cytochrome c biogenesis protein CcdA
MILYLLAYLGGALTIVSPCILPVLHSCAVPLTLNLQKRGPDHVRSTPQLRSS